MTIGAFVVAGLVVVVLGLSVTERIVYRGRVLPGVETEPLNIAGDTEQEAFAKLQAVGTRLETTPLTAHAADTDLVLQPADIDLHLDAAATVRAARRTGRDTNPLGVMFGTIHRRIRPDVVKLRVTWDHNKLDTTLDAWSEQLGVGLENGGLRFTGATVVAIPPTSGTGLLPGPTRHRVEDALETASTAVVALPIGHVAPPIGAAEVNRAAARARMLLSAPVTIIAETASATLTADQIGSVLDTQVKKRELELVVSEPRLRALLAPVLAPVEKVPVDATWSTQGNVATVVPSQAGRAVDLAAAGTAIADGHRVVVATFKEQPPVHDTAWAEKLNITELVSTFTTNHPAGQDRVKNIHLGADRINGVVVAPGETFSLNDFLGPRTPDKGWVQAPVFSTDEGFFADYGGGLSQLTTTLYNAVFFGGYRDVEHRPHTIYISRYPMGREATLNYGSIDLKFQDDSNSGVFIRTSYTATSITVSFYGNKEGRTVKAEGPNILETVPLTTETIDTPFFPPGSERTEVGYTGYKVENFRVVSRPGQPDKRERYLWTYDMVPTKVYRGLQPAAPPTTTTGPAAPAAPPPTGG